MSDTAAARHVREYRGVLAAAERRLLEYLARRLPAWVTSDGLTLLGLGGMLAAGAAFAAVRVTPWAAAGVIVALAVNWFGDSLDGTLARVRQRQRPRYGFYVDHVIDFAGIGCLFVGMALSGHMSPVIAIGLLAGYLLVAGESFLATHVVGRFRMATFGVGPTELRILLASGAIWMAEMPWITIAGRTFRPFDVGGAIAIAGFVVAFVASSLRNTRDLYRAEPLPPMPTDGAGKSQSSRLARAAFARWAMFAVVGAVGFCVQLGTVAALVAAGWPYLVATAAAVELTVIHNFVWHEHWTWAERRGPGILVRFLRFNAATGMMSILGNVVFMAIYVGALGIHPLVATALSVGSMAIANFAIADRLVFVKSPGN